MYGRDVFLVRLALRKDIVGVGGEEIRKLAYRARNYIKWKLSSDLMAYKVFWCAPKTVGLLEQKAFFKKYSYNKFKFINISRNEQRVLTNEVLKEILWYQLPM